jgi:hypothetical protein
MKALRHGANPRNYEIWFTYATGYYPALNQQINASLKAKGTISEPDLIQIYESYLSPTRLTDRIDEVGSQVKSEIDQVMAMIESVAGTATPKASPARPSSSLTQKITTGFASSSKIWCKPPRSWSDPINSWKSGWSPPRRRSTSFR